MNFNKLLKRLFLSVFLISSIAYAQTVHQVAAGTDVLKAAIDAAASGDIIELTTSGGIYLSADQIKLTKDITIRGRAELAEKPILKYIGTSTGAYMFKVESSPKIVVKNLEFDGDGTAEGGAALAKYALRLDSGDTLGTMNVRVEDCVLHDFNEKIIKPYPDSGIDSLIVHNSIFYNGAKEGVTLYSGSSGDPAVRLKYAEFENCTFYGFVREGIKADTNPNTIVRINHCTFYDCGGSSKGMIYVDDLLDVEVKNSIFVKSGFADNFARFESDANIFKNNVFFDVASHVITKATVSDTLFADPLFADAANGDFTLDAASQAIGYADDGSAAGDMRWDPTAAQPKVHKVEAGTDVLKAAIDAAASGDIIELTTSGGEYLSADQIVLDKDITIRGRAELAQKPVLKYIGTSTGAYMFKVVSSPKIVVKNLEFDGDGTAEGGAALAKYALRLDNADTAGTMNVRVENCVLHDFNEKIIKPYPDSGIDSLIVHNSTFYNGAKEGVTLYSGSSGDPAVRLKYAEFENCTFYGFVREGIKADTNPNTVARVNHCTFYDCGGSSKGMIYFDDLLDVEVKNSIFVKSGFADNFARFESDANIFKNNVFFDVASHVITQATVSDTLFADPLFADAANGDFTLDAASQARTAGEGGTPAGDLRWAIDPNSVLVTLNTVGNGVVTLNPSGGVYSPGTEVTFTAVPDANWEFVGWTGLNVFPPNTNPATVAINESITVTATFQNLVPQATLTTDVIGLGEVQASPEVGDDGTYDEGAEITLTAVPELETWEFVEWQGDLSGSDNPITFTLDSNMTAIASFRSTLPQVSLSFDIVGMGSVSVDPDTIPGIGTYDVNTEVTVTAEAAKGWEFDGFSYGSTQSSESVITIAMDSSKVVTVEFKEIQSATGVLAIDDSWDLKDAADYANNNSTINTIEFSTSGGVYTTTSTSTVNLLKPLTLRAAEGLEEKPILTNSDPSTSGYVLDILRVFDDITVEGVVFDGGHESSVGMKYGVRLRNTDDNPVKVGANVKFDNCDFINFFEAKDAKKDGHAFKIDVEVQAGDVLFENCTFANFGYEAIRISDTEKWVTDKAVNSLTVRNCTFTNIDAECVRYYSDLDPQTPDAPVLLEHITINNSATRVFYLKNSGGAIVRDIIVANSRQSGHGRDGDVMDCQGNTGVTSTVSYLNIFNVAEVEVKSTDGVVDSSTIFNLDPQFKDPENMDYTLLETSPMYGLAHDGSAMGDLNWAVGDPVGVEEVEILPTEFAIDQNYPNPFNPTTQIRFAIPVNASVSLKIYDILGREVSALLSNETLSAGHHKYTWNSKNDFGQQLSSGVYIYRINAKGINGKEFVKSMKMMFIK